MKTARPETIGRHQSQPFAVRQPLPRHGGRCEIRETIIGNEERGAEPGFDQQQ